MTNLVVQKYFTNSTMKTAKSSHAKPCTRLAAKPFQYDAKTFKLMEGIKSGLRVVPDEINRQLFIMATPDLIIYMKRLVRLST